MSYILDALRRADSERAAVPGLHAQALAPGGEDEDDGDSPAAQRSRVRWIGPALAVLLLLAGLAWWWMPASSPAPEPTVGVEPVSAARPPPPIPGPAPVAARPGLPPIAAVGELPPLPETPPQRPPATDERAPLAATRGARAGSAPLQLDALPAGSPPPLAAPARAGRPDAAASAQAPRIYALSELPEEVRRELPSLQVAGSVYSPDPASRMLILNGQLFHEQDDLGNGVKVEQIKARSAVLSFRGYRYQISY